ncbi:LL-diaminopimelate aminotransferase [Fundicoccus culcitae]|uniref:Aminotransferase n=1 Tax=Fundicoccus culcitae TaxID=2969821 RepID=A0ABY5P5U7_9LACT|nr:LL-diaminopimelate aminotransferase [Fundicoccus culcitae]UUX34054.1 LL-diaminopimelate aminotransferase [Fundicoccus culcitae]
MRVNPNFAKFKEDYVYVSVKEKLTQYMQTHPPQAEILDLSIGDVSFPLNQGVIEAIHLAADQQGKMDTFHGYSPKKGHPFLVRAILENDYQAKGIPVNENEIFISDGAKSDVAHIQDLFAEDITIAVVDPFYPVYIDSNVMASRAGEYDEKTHRWSRLVYLEANEDNAFVPNLPQQAVDVIYLNYPNNPTGKALTQSELQAFVDYANQHQALIIYDAAYEAFIQSAEIPRSIYTCQGARNCAIEIKSFSKSAGFTGLRLGYMIIPEDLVYEGQSLNEMWARREATKFNGASFIIQKAGQAVYQPRVKAEIKANIQHYLANACRVKESLIEAGFVVYGGENAPYLWVKSIHEQSSWAFFEELLNKYQVVSTPGSAYGTNGENFVRLSMFAADGIIDKLIKRLKEL